MERKRFSQLINYVTHGTKIVELEQMITHAKDFAKFKGIPIDNIYIAQDHDGCDDNGRDCAADMVIMIWYYESEEMYQLRLRYAG